MLTGIGLSSSFHPGVGFVRPMAPSIYPTAKTVRQPANGIVLRHLAGDAEQQYFLYVPPQGGAGAPVFVTVHGVSRNAEEHARRFKRLAKQYGVVLVAPVVFYIWILHQNPKFVAIDKEADDDIMHFLQLGETNGLANQPFDPRPQG